MTPAPPAPARLESEIHNADTHVWRVRLSPGQSSVAHRHNHPRVVVVLRGGSLRLDVKGATPRTLPWEGGKVYWIPADVAGEYHSYVNDGDQPVEFIYVEFERSQ